MTFSLVKIVILHVYNHVKIFLTFFQGPLVRRLCCHQEEAEQIIDVAVDETVV